MPPLLRPALYRRHRTARLQGADVDDGDTVEGYHIHVGGGFGPDATIAPEIYDDIKAEDAPRVVELLLKAYLAHRLAAGKPGVHPARDRRAASAASGE